MKEYKITTYLPDLIDAYNEPVQRIDGLVRRPKEIIRKVEFYSVDQFLSGNKDELGRVKPFINHGNSRVRVAKTATDIDLKEINFEADSLTYAVQAMLINKEFFKWAKDNNFSNTLNEMGITRPKYGGVLVKKCEDDGKLEIEVVDWANVEFDPACIKDGAIIEHHYMDASELMKKAELWTGFDDIKDVFKAHAKATKNKPSKIEILEVTGEFSYSFDPELDESEANDAKFKDMCFYIAKVNKKNYLLYKEDLPEGEDKYKYLAWEKVGEGLGRGVWEEGFESQMRINDQYIQMKNALDLSGKVFTKGTARNLGNAITDVDNGHHFDLKANETLEAFQLSTAALPQFENLINQFSNEYNRISSTYDANTGEQPPSGTPLGQTQILNQVANSPFQYQQEVWGLWLNDILNDWVMPYLKKNILKDHDLVADFSEDELNEIDEAISNEHINPQIAQMMFDRKEVTPEIQQGMVDETKKGLSKFGTKREIKIPKKFLDVGGKLTANITGEMKNKQAILQSMDSIMGKVVQSFDPNTGKYGVLENPTLNKLFKTMVEMAGIPFSSVQLGNTAGKGGTAPTSMTPDLTAMQTQGQPAPVMAQ